MYATTFPLLLLGIVLALTTAIATDQELQLATPGGGNRTEPVWKPSTELFQTEKMYFREDSSLPLVIKLNKGFLPETKALIEATTRKEYSWFAVELRSSTSGDIALQIHGRPYEHKIVKNSRRMEALWGKEEVEEGVSFLPSDKINVAIVCLRAAINITINSHPVGGFSHRLSPSIIDELRISGGLSTRLVAYTTPITQATLQGDGGVAVGDSFPESRPKSSSTASQVIDDSNALQQVFKDVKDDATRIRLITRIYADKMVEMEKNYATLQQKLLGMAGDIRELQKEKDRIQEELSLVLAMGIIEWMENGYSKGFNATGDVLRGQNVRKAKWTFMLKNRRDEKAIKEILDKIHAEDFNNDEENLINNIIEIENILKNQEKRFVERVSKAGSFLNPQKHRLILKRNPFILLIFADHLPSHVVKTSILLQEVYVNEISRRAVEEKVKDIDRLISR